MKKIKAVVAVLLCFVMLLSMAGCGTKEKDAGGSTTTVEKPKNEEDKMKAYDPAKKYKFSIICSSSKNGAEFAGAPGSELIVDDIEIINAE